MMGTNEELEDQKYISGSTKHPKKGSTNTYSGSKKILFVYLMSDSKICLLNPFYFDPTTSF